MRNIGGSSFIHWPVKSSSSIHYVYYIQALFATTKWNGIRYKKQVNLHWAHRKGNQPNHGLYISLSATTTHRRSAGDCKCSIIITIFFRPLVLHWSHQPSLLLKQGTVLQGSLKSNRAQERLLTELSLLPHSPTKPLISLWGASWCFSPRWAKFHPRFWHPTDFTLSLDPTALHQRRQLFTPIPGLQSFYQSRIHPDP